MRFSPTAILAWMKKLECKLIIGHKFKKYQELKIICNYSSHMHDLLLKFLSWKSEHKMKSQNVLFASTVIMKKTNGFQRDSRKLWAPIGGFFCFSWFNGRKIFKKILLYADSADCWLSGRTCVAWPNITKLTHILTDRRMDKVASIRPFFA